MRVPRRYNDPSTRQRCDAALLQGGNKRFWRALSQHLLRACSRPIDQGAILSLVERKSKLTRLHKLQSKAATEVKDTSITLLTPLVDRVHTITVDNGKEFVQHEEITAALKAPIYFAHPHAAWERGLNENTNGLIRQYFPKKYDFTRITNTDVQLVADLLNNRPRKTLGYRTPNEVFFKERYVALPN